MFWRHPWNITIRLRSGSKWYRGFIGDVTTLHRRVHVRGDVPRSIFACVRCLIRRIKVIGYGNLAYGERKGRGFISTLLANTEEILFGVPGIFIFLFFFLSYKCSRIKMEGFFFNGREFCMAFNWGEFSVLGRNFTVSWKFKRDCTWKIQV